MVQRVVRTYYSWEQVDCFISSPPSMFLYFRKIFCMHNAHCTSISPSRIDYHQSCFSLDISMSPHHVNIITQWPAYIGTFWQTWIVALLTSYLTVLIICPPTKVMSLCLLSKYNILWLDSIYLSSLLKIFILVWINYLYLYVDMEP